MLLLPFDSTCIQSINTYEMDPGLTILFSRLYILYFYFYSLLCFCFGMLGVLSTSFGMTILFGVLMRESYASHFAYNWKFQDACKIM